MPNKKTTNEAEPGLVLQNAIFSCSDHKNMTDLCIFENHKSLKTERKGTFVCFQFVFCI